MDEAYQGKVRISGEVLPLVSIALRTAREARFGRTVEYHIEHKSRQPIGNPWENN